MQGLQTSRHVLVLVCCALRPCIVGARSDWNHTYAVHCYDTNTSFNNPACNCFGEPTPDAIRTTRPAIRILVSSWPAAAFDAFLLNIILEERFGSAQPRPHFPDLRDPRAHKRGLTGRICAGTRRFPRRDFAGRSAPAPTPSVFTCVHRDCRYPVQLIEDSDDSMANLDSVVGG
jgi:hypothetical protein